MHSSPTGTRLIQLGLITEDQLRIALHEQRRNRAMLGTTLVRLGFLQETALADVLADRTGLESIDLAQADPDPALIRRLPKAVAARCRAVPLRLEDGTLEVAMADPYDVMAMDEIRRHFPDSTILTPYVAAAAAIDATLARSYAAETPVEALLQELESDSPNAHEQHPMVRLVDHLLQEAVRQRASDVHLEPESGFVRVRYRIDGRLHQLYALHRTHWPALSHRLKIMAGMNIADTRSIQDGRFQIPMGGGTVDFRVAVMPTVWGETIVVRVLDHRRALLPLEALGFSATSCAALQTIMERPQGLTLVTGPTGSGKTTTLYSLLRQLSTPDVHIATLEEPVEYQLELIRQTAVREEQGLDFGAGVRGLLRMDPDILLIGEVRDADTAQMALRAAITGHQVYSTLHCKDVWSALPRLIDLGLNPRMIAGNVSGLIAQRLVRKLCPHCKQERQATPDEGRLLHRNQAVVWEAVGCSSCDHTGTRGRTVVSEVLCLTDSLDDLIASDAPRALLLKEARAQGFQTLQEDAVSRVLAGEVALEDVRRVVDLTRGEAVVNEKPC